MPKREEIDVDWPWAQKFPFHSAIKVGDTVWVSGIVAWDPDGNIVGEDDMLVQTRQTFANMQRYSCCWKNPGRRWTTWSRSRPS